MSEFIYLPVPTKEMMSFAQSFQKARAKAGKNKPTILRNSWVSGFMKGVSRYFSGGCLKTVHQGHTLFVILHGAGVAGGRFVGASRNGAQKKYTPEQLALNLHKEGLADSFDDLHLLSCGAGLDVDDDGKLHKPFVAKVSEALKNLGYKRIRVTGYMGNVKPGIMGGFGVEIDTGLGWDVVDDKARVTVL